MRRREFVTLLGGAAASYASCYAFWPLAARAQQPARLPTIGFLGTTSALAWSQYVAPFAQRLHELGWIESRTVAIEYRWAEGRRERLIEIASEFARLKVDVIVTAGSAFRALKQATSAVPIVLAIAEDPVEAGFVASLARPGGNITGLAIQRADSLGKRLELLREVVPGLRRLAVLANVGDPNTVREMGEVEAAAHTLGLAVAKLEIRRADDIDPAFAALKGGADALYVCADPLVNTNRVRINSLALAARLPTMHFVKVYVEAGGLMSYGPSFADLFRRSADYVDKILRGVKPGDIPIEQPTRFELVVNLTTAKALGLTIPESFLLRADEVIE
jgi:putative tryptophan/tyrosine transport system substrate-binding protein